jgi:hypothetical protein
MLPYLSQVRQVCTASNDSCWCFLYGQNIGATRLWLCARELMGLTSCGDCTGLRTPVYAVLMPLHAAMLLPASALSAGPGWQAGV